MDASETLVKERFDSAVGGLSPDVTSLVGAGVTAGRGIRRRRRLMGAGAAAVTAAVVGTAAATGGLGGLLNADGPDPAGTISQLEPATPRGLAAAVMTHTADLGTLTVVGGQRLDDTGASGLAAGFGYSLAGGGTVEMEVYASPETAKLRNRGICASATSDVTCTQSTLPDGTSRAVIDAASTGAGTVSGEQDTFSLLGVGLLRDDQFILVIATTSGQAEAPLDVADLEAIAADPAVGLSTTGELNAEGLTIPDFKDSLTTSSSSSSSGSASAPTPIEKDPPANGSSASRSAPPR